MARKKKSRQKRRKDWLGVSLILLSALLITGVVAFYAWQSRTKVEIDKETLCPKSGPQEICIVLVDQTDEFSTVQRSSVRQHLKAVRDEIPRHGLLELYAVGPVHKELLKPLFRLCNPGRGREIDPLIGNPGLVEKRWHEEFSTKLESVFEVVLTPTHSQASPIMESLQSLGVSAFGDPSLTNIPKRLIVVSDMLHHTPQYSQYSNPGDFQKFRATDYYLKVRPQLKDVQVEILYLRRTTRTGIQGEKHINFWESYFSDAGARVIRVASVEG